MGFWGDLVQGVIEAGAESAAERMHPMIAARVRHLTSDGWKVVRVSSTSVTLKKSGFIWDSTTTLGIAPNGEIFEMND
jgi:hypothetical protein